MKKQMTEDEEPGECSRLSSFIKRLIVLSMIDDGFGKGETCERILVCFTRLLRDRYLGSMSNDVPDTVDTKGSV